jgi:hypothetical protein
VCLVSLQQWIQTIQGMFYNSLLGMSGLFTTIAFSFGHCVFCSSSIYGFWLPPFGIFKFFLLKGDYCKTYPVLSGSIATKHTHKTKDRVTRTPLKTGGELRCSTRVSSSFSTSGTRRVNLVTNPLINHEWGKDQEVFTTSGTYLWSL